MPPGHNTQGSANFPGDGNFKPYNINEYRQVKDMTSKQKMGGLGANIGGEEWEKAQRKKEQQQMYAQQVKATIKPKQNPVQAPKPKEVTARDKALEFAKNNIPKPKVKPPSAAGQKGNTNPEDQDMLYDQPMSGPTEQQRAEMEMLDRKNKMYANELEKIKSMFNE